MRETNLLGGGSSGKASGVGSSKRIVNANLSFNVSSSGRIEEEGDEQSPLLRQFMIQTFL